MRLKYSISSTPASVLNYPSMSSRGEKALLYALAKNMYRGEGAIVDAGIFLGASTNAFARGLKAKKTASRLDGGKPIHSYDNAIWTRSMDKYLKYPPVQKALKGKNLNAHDSFLPLLQSLLAEHLDMIDFRIGDIVQTANADADIEIAFYDCLKTEERDAAAFRTFAPKYVPSHTLVIQQDYFYEGAIHNKIRQEYFASHFSYLGEEATSAIFAYETPISPSAIEADPIRALEPDEKLRLLEQAASRPKSLKGRTLTELSIVTFCLDNRMLDAAVARLCELESAAKALNDDGTSTRPLSVVTRLWKRIRNEEFEASSDPLFSRA